MTVAELRKALEGVPDDVRVLVADEGGYLKVMEYTEQRAGTERRDGSYGSLTEAGPVKYLLFF